MGIVSDSSLLELLLAVVALSYLLYWYITNNNDYWDNRGVPNVKIGLGMGLITGKKSQYELVYEIYKTFSDERYCGLFQFKDPVLMVRDTELIHKILVKDFTHFQDRGQPKAHNDPLSESLFGLEGQVWRAMRYRLTPTFTTGKLKGMFEQISKCGNNMLDKLDVLSKEETHIDSKICMFEFTLDVIASCAFGLQIKPDSPEFNELKGIVNYIFSVKPLRAIQFLILMQLPLLARILKVSSFSKQATDYFMNLTKATINYRQTNNIQRNDYFQLLLTLKEQEESGKDMGLSTTDISEDDAVVNQMQYTEENNQPPTTNMKLITDEAICANTFIFLTAGSESTAATISFLLFELSRHPDIQQRVQTEVDSVLAKHGGWSYETIKGMTYLDQVIQESQRMYPIIPFLIRKCNKPYKVPDSDFIIDKGVIIQIPTIGLHKDPKHYPDPEQFKPERFEGNNFKPNSVFLPFGDGPRMCIAMRFAVLEIKTCVARILSQYSVKLSPKTQLPLQFEKRSFVPTVKGGIWVTFEKRNITKT